MEVHHGTSIAKTDSLVAHKLAAKTGLLVTHQSAMKTGSLVA
jgi:hypothetical protein